MRRFQLNNFELSLVVFYVFKNKFLGNCTTHEPFLKNRKQFEDILQQFVTKTIQKLQGGCYHLNIYLQIHIKQKIKQYDIVRRRLQEVIKSQRWSPHELDQCLTREHEAQIHCLHTFGQVRIQNLSTLEWTAFKAPRQKQRTVFTVHETCW